MKKKVQAYQKRFILFVQQITKTSIKQMAIAFPLALIIFLVLILAAYHLAYWNRIYPGITVVDQPIGNLTPHQAENIIQNIGSRFTENTLLTLTADDQQWQINLLELNFTYDAGKTAQKAYEIGRSEKMVKNLSMKIKAWSKGIDLGVEYSLDQDLLEAKTASIAAQVFVPTIEPTIKIVNQQIEIEQGKDGQELDKRHLTTLISYQLARVNFDPIEIPLIHLSPTLTPEEIENTRQRAESFLGKKIVLVNGEKEWPLEEAELIQLLSFTGGFDQEKIASWAATLASTIDRPPENAAFQFSGGKAAEFRPAREGKTLNQNETIRSITDALSKLESSSDEIATISLTITTTPPVIKTADVNTLGINELIGQGVSYFRGSITSRIHNIQLASSKLNGVLISPGETFSFNQTLGEVSKDTGYQEAYIIKEGRTVLGDGGGVCQVSTTLFRAALNAGLPIVERHPHAYRVSYYEQNSPVGLDATVFEPTADLKFTNDTSAHILIQTTVNTVNKKLTFDLYGSDDGRLVTISESRLWDQTPPPPDLYQDDPTLPTGTIKQIDWKAWGGKAAFDWKVVRGNEVLQDRTFYSAYRPWQAVFLRGTGPTP